MATYDASAAAGQIFPIVGAGIGLGILAHTARGVTETMFPSRYSQKSMRRPRTQRSRTRKRAPKYQQPYRYRRPQYGYWR